MQICPDTVVSFHYRLSEADGAELESSRDGDPMLFLCGHNNILPALEKAMLEKSAGDSFSVTLTPDQAYGARRDDAVQRIPVKHLISKVKLRPGMVAKVQTEHGLRDVRLVKLGRFSADVDTNHPFAGMSLQFEVEIVDVREASADEIAHKHAHGPGGHHH